MDQILKSELEVLSLLLLMIKYTLLVGIRQETKSYLITKPYCMFAQSKFLAEKAIIGKPLSIITIYIGMIILFQIRTTILKTFLNLLPLMQNGEALAH